MRMPESISDRIERKYLQKRIACQRAEIERLLIVEHLYWKRINARLVYTQSQLDEAVRAAVEAEREECAKVADRAAKISGWIDEVHCAHAIAAAIRARGETK